jgi:hypothetical protein
MHNLNIFLKFIRPNQSKDYYKGCKETLWAYAYKIGDDWFVGLRESFDTAFKEIERLEQESTHVTLEKDNRRKLQDLGKQD